MAPNEMNLKSQSHEQTRGRVGGWHKVSKETEKEEIMLLTFTSPVFLHMVCVTLTQTAILHLTDSELHALWRNIAPVSYTISFFNSKKRRPKRDREFICLLIKPKDAALLFVTQTLLHSVSWRSADRWPLNLSYSTALEPSSVHIWVRWFTFLKRKCFARDLRSTSTARHSANFAGFTSPYTFYDRECRFASHDCRNSVCLT